MWQKLTATGFAKWILLEFIRPGASLGSSHLCMKLMELLNKDLLAVIDFSARIAWIVPLSDSELV